MRTSKLVGIASVSKRIYKEMKVLQLAYEAEKWASEEIK